MNCSTCREKLLRSLDPSGPSAEVTAHLAGCDDCRQYQQRLVRIEANVPRIPVPPSVSTERGLEAIKKLLRQPVPSSEPTESPLIVRRAPSTSRPSTRRLPWGLIAAGLAASLLLAAVGIMLHRPGQPENIAKKNGDTHEQTPLLAQLLECDLRLAVDHSPAERTVALADLTGLLQTGIESKPDDGSLKTMTALYRSTLSDGLVASAKKLPVEDREQVLPPVVEDLVVFQERVIVLAPGQPSIQEAAEAARDAENQLRALLPAGSVKIGHRAGKQRTLAVDWRRDLPLIQEMVALGRKLALENDPLKRAQHAHELAEKLGKEIQQAAQARDGVRAAELSQCLQALLTRGVADNLSQTTQQMLAPSQSEIDNFARSVSQSTRAIEADLKKAIAPDTTGMEKAFNAVSDARIEVENSVKDQPARKKVSPATKK